MKNVEQQIDKLLQEARCLRRDKSISAAEVLYMRIIEILDSIYPYSESSIAWEIECECKEMIYDNYYNGNK